MVLIEAYSIVIQTQAVADNFKGGMAEFLSNLPNKTQVSDGELERVGFIIWEDLVSYANYLISGGLKRGRDFTVFHMTDGIIGGKCPWAKWARLKWFEGCTEEFSFAWLSSEYGGREEPVAACPEGWSPYRSIKEADLMDESEFRTRVQLLKDDNGFCTYYAKWADQVRYVGRS